MAALRSQIRSSTLFSTHQSLRVNRLARLGCLGPTRPPCATLTALTRRYTLPRNPKWPITPDLSLLTSSQYRPHIRASFSSGGTSPGSKQEPPKKKLIRDRLLPSLTPHENIYTVPNVLTFSRLLAAPVVGYLVLHDYHAWAVGLFVYAGITDLVDGYIARRWNLQTVVGTVIDPMADKTLMTILTVCLAIKGALPVWLAAIILGRDIGLGIAAIYYRWISLPPPKTFSRYWDFSLPSAEVHPTTISKINTFLQLALIGATTAQPLIAADVSGAMMAMQYLVATTTVWSGASYVYTKDAVKILSKQEREEKGEKGDPKR
ncbi:MAG: hypothetical protein M1812_003834 [Candelaria pacifica]|nr:MAG: hypothetical protein M1812_003834 [Candelaria pacifica]